MSGVGCHRPECAGLVWAGGSEATDYPASEFCPKGLALTALGAAPPHRLWSGPQQA